MERSHHEYEDVNGNEFELEPGVKLREKETGAELEVNGHPAEGPEFWKNRLVQMSDEEFQDAIDKGDIVLNDRYTSDNSPNLDGEEARVIASFLDEEEWAEAEGIIGEERVEEIRSHVTQP